ncbi:PREDICTED: thyroid transcription factor 1-associated protein 26 homolog [Dufourea novaeangliae]|uniref:Thyroid transcription factor 1-associated protein 26 like protein n=1 Tax=Dufourea novaeangliae TaxID=178035 RepID=A0A154PR17_DUFNO|nr:PREDICTED: thyroid transcription factor 1-associated protein 26 homolog [Dufourea novaeangliae]KZC14356.1 Thyroid transcription factor 1-associated protein 26 like protein [Dufourea novaeangliae]
MKARVNNDSNGQQSKDGNEKNRNNEKKPFDKKKYRTQKYSNKYKINQWEERRKKAILRDYYKELDKSQRDSKKPLSLKDGDQDKNDKQMQVKKISAFHKAKKEFLRKKDEKRERKEEAMRVKSEREEALKKYKQKRMQTYKKLSKKTKKGQPVMKDRLEMLLEKIQQQISD